MESREEAQIALDHALKMQPVFGLKGEHNANLVVAKNVVDEEMGRYGDHLLDYQLQQKTKDTLLAHGRQDVAHALCNTKSLLDHSAKISSQLRTLNIFAALSFVMLAAIVAKLYPQFFPGVH
jgi:hypothetical protein